MTTTEVAERIGYTNNNGVSAWARRVGVRPLYKQAGHKGQNVYLATEVEAGLARMRGRGVGGGRRRLRARSVTPTDHPQ